MSTFSDISDHATELEEREREILLAQHKARVADALQPIGQCHNCELKVEGNALFCSKECAEEWEFIKKMEKHR